MLPRRAHHICSENRASDLRHLNCNQVFRLRDREGFLIWLSLTNTVCKGALREFILVPFRDPDVCSMLWLEYKALGVSLSRGYFFRGSDRGRSVGKRPFLDSEVRNRLRVHLSDAQFCDGKHPTASGSGFPTLLACWAVLRKRSPCIWLGKVAT